MPPVKGYAYVNENPAALEAAAVQLRKIHYGRQGNTEATDVASAENIILKKLGEWAPPLDMHTRPHLIRNAQALLRGTPISVRGTKAAFQQALREARVHTLKQDASEVLQDTIMPIMRSMFSVKSPFDKSGAGTLSQDRLLAITPWTISSEVDEKMAIVSDTKSNIAEREGYWAALLLGANTGYQNASDDSIHERVCEMIMGIVAKVIQSGYMNDKATLALRALCILMWLPGMPMQINFFYNLLDILHPDTPLQYDDDFTKNDIAMVYAEVEAFAKGIWNTAAVKQVMQSLATPVGPAAQVVWMTAIIDVVGEAPTAMAVAGGSGGAFAASQPRYSKERPIPRPRAGAAIGGSSSVRFQQPENPPPTRDFEIWDPRGASDQY